MTTTVAVLGLGAMGLPMATNLAREFAVTGFDISPERTALAAEAGLRGAADAGEAAGSYTPLTLPTTSRV